MTSILLGSDEIAARPEASPLASPSSRSTKSEQQAQRRRRAPVDGLTTVDRERPYSDNPALLAREEQFAREAPDQLPLFAPGPAGAFAPVFRGLPPLSSHSSLELARAWYRRELEQAGRPVNTIESYCYDLVVLEKLIGPKPIDAIGQSDIARLLGDANGRATRKRRLTSARRFFRFLIDDARVLRADPTDGHYPHTIPLRSPVPLFPAEQYAMLDAAAGDEPWSLPATWLMLRLGLTRSELLSLRREHIDLADPSGPVVYIFYDDPHKRGKERKLAAGQAFSAIYEAFLEARAPVDLLFAVGPQAVNGMVDRVREAAGIQKEVTPQTLRHTFAVDRANAGATEEDLLALLGLADDARNRASVQRYLKLAAPPL
jgi:integrase/recombinase XerD